MQLGIMDVTVVLATQADECRKPDTGMWAFFIEHLNDGVAPSAGPASQHSLVLHAGRAPPRPPINARECPHWPCELTASAGADLYDSLNVGDAAGRLHDFSDSQSWRWWRRSNALPRVLLHVHKAGACMRAAASDDADHGQALHSHAPSV